MYGRVIKYISTSYRQIFLYLLVGGTTFMVDYGAFYVLFAYYGVPLFIANAVGLLAGFIVSFTGNRTVVFRSNRSNTNLSIYKQLVLYGILLSLNTLLSYWVIKLCLFMGVAAVVGKIISMAVIILWNFVLYRNIIFKKKQLTGL